MTNETNTEQTKNKEIETGFLINLKAIIKEDVLKNKYNDYEIINKLK